MRQETVGNLEACIKERKNLVQLGDAMWVLWGSRRGK